MKKQILYFTIFILFLCNQNGVFAAPVTVDSKGDVGAYTSITIVNGNPAISYYDRTSRNLKYVRASKAAGTAWDAPVTVDSKGDVGSYTSITVVKGNPAICYYDRTNESLKYVRAANVNGTVWYTPVTIDSKDDVGVHPSITIVNGNPAISYYDWTNKNLKYVRAANASGTAWHTPIILDSKDAVGSYNSITIVNNNPAISYFDPTNGDLKYIRASNTNGTAWYNPVIIDFKGYVGSYTSITVANGNPAISYYDWTNKNLKYVRADNALGTAWNAPVTLDSNDDVGEYTSITIVNGNPAISYIDYTNKSLKYVKASNASGTKWGTPVTIDSTGVVGKYNSITNVKGNPAISYYDSTNKDLKFTRYVPASLSNLYFSHIASDTTWKTEICIINKSGADELTGVAKAYDNSGTLISSKTVNLKRNGRKSFIVDKDFIQPSKIGYIVFEPDSTAACGYTKFHVSGKYRVAIPATSHINTNDIYIPHIASNNKWWTGLSLVNTTSSNKTITIEFDNSTKKNILLKANAHKVLTISSLFSGIPQPLIKSAIIKNGSGVVGLELFGSYDSTGKKYLSGILLSDEATNNLYYPHITKDTKWWTGLVAYNPAALSAHLTIQSYKSDGTALGSKSIDLPGKTKYIGTPGTLNLPVGSAWFQISSNRPISGFELFGTNNGKQLAGYTGVNINSKTGIFPKLEKNGWTGIAFVNLGNSNASVRLKAFNDSGVETATKLLSLKAHEKKVGAAETLFGKTLVNATYITYGSSNDCVGFQLNGSTNGLLLDALPGH